MTNHTPTPWVYIQGQIYSSKLDSNTIATVNNNDENGEFIVRACNSHEHLVKALDECFRVFRMDEVDTSISLMVAMALSEAKVQS